MGRHTQGGWRIRSADMERLSAESREFCNFIKKDLFNKVPSVSTLVGIVVGAYVSSSFSTSPLRGMLSAFGIIDAGDDVVSPVAYKLLSVFLPLFAAATAVYMVQKWLKSYRKCQIRRYKEAAARLDEARHSELESKVSILEQARESGLLSSGEHDAKLVALYHNYTKTLLPPGLEEFIVKKLTS